MERRNPDFLLLWLALTPLFAVLDFGLGWNIRVAGLEAPGHRALYYGGLVVLALLAWRWPRWEPPLALAEIVVNLSLLIIGAWLMILLLPPGVEAGSRAPDVGYWVNFLLAGGFGYLAFQRLIRELHGAGFR